MHIHYYTYTGIHSHALLHIYRYTFTYITTHIQVYIHIHYYTYTDIHSHILLHIYRYTCTYITTHIQVYIHIHTGQASFAYTPQTEEIGLKIITTAKISNKFSQESPYISNTFSRESPKFHREFHVSKQSPRHPKENPGKLDNLRIQIL